MATRMALVQKRENEVGSREEQQERFNMINTSRKGVEAGEGGFGRVSSFFPLSMCSNTHSPS